MGIRTRHPDKALTVVGIKALKKPGRYADGNGLYLKVSRSGAYVGSCAPSSAASGATLALAA
jgi:hypothetical protein